MTPPETAAQAGRLLSRAWGDLRSCWLVMGGATLLCTAIATIILLPLIGMSFQLLINRSHSPAVADIDIARFFFTSVPGAVALVLVSALVAAVTALEQACLMSAGLGHARGIALRVRDAFAHAATRVAPILGLTMLLVVRLLLLLVPFALVIGGTCWLLLRNYDINYYLTDRPAAF